MTSLQLVSGGQVVPVHIVLNNDTKKGLIVGETVPSSLTAAFAKAGITYVDRHDQAAKVKTEKALNDLTDGMGADVKGALRDAFGYRNVIGAIPAGVSPLTDLSAYLVDDKVEENFAKFVLRNSKSGSLLPG